MILRKYTNLKFSEGNPSWKSLLVKFRQMAMNVINMVINKDDILYYLEWGEDFAINIKPTPLSPRTDGTYIFLKDGDGIGLVLFHNLGVVWILKYAVFNVLTNMGFSPRISESHNDVYLDGKKVFGERVGISDTAAWESGQLNINWDGSGINVSNLEDESDPTTINEMTAEEKLKPITGLEQEATRVKISFDRKDVEPLLIAEIERLLKTTEVNPVPKDKKIIIKDSTNNLSFFARVVIKLKKMIQDLKNMIKNMIKNIYNRSVKSKNSEWKHYVLD
jgi:hypothetical protein